MKNILLPTVVMFMVLAAASAHADETFAPFLGFNTPLEDSTGNPISSGTWELVVDLNGNGWQGNSYLAQGAPGSDSSSSWQWDSGDLVLGRGSIADGQATPSAILSGNPASTIPGYDAGVDHYYALWFNETYAAGTAGPGGGIQYGAEDLGTVGNNGDTLSPLSNGGKASLLTVPVAAPEPVSYVLALLGGGAMALRRRFRMGIAK